MKVLIISKDGDGMGVAHKLAQQNNDVVLWVKNPDYEDLGKGIVKRVASWRQGLDAELVICDMVGFGHMEEILKKLGKPVISCSMILEQAELDRAKGMSLFRSVGIEIPETYRCANPAEAKKIVTALPWENGWVTKPFGNQENSTTMLVKSRDALDWALGTLPAEKLIMQRIVEGVEVSTEGWFNGREFIRPYNHTFEEKKFMNDDLGPTVGCMGNVVFTVGSNKLTKATVEKLAPFLNVIGYHGPVDVNCMVSQDHAYGLEITARMGYDAIESLIEGLREPAINLFFECATGTKKTMNITRDTMMAVSLSIPPYPHADPNEKCKGAPVRGLTPEVLKHVALVGLYLDKDGLYKTAGIDGPLLRATSVGSRDETKGDYTREAQRRVYRTLKNISVSGKQYRTDVGDRVNDEVHQLKEWGWL
jgi:phosphoribosylamine---glycine ligase